jgi:apoptosis-inducing factor 3
MVMGDATQTIGPDLESGVQEEDLGDGGMLVGHVGQESVLLARRREEVFAIGATCTHYGGPLGEGLMVEDTVRCPWHHACFSLRTGEALTAPAFAATSRWRVERRDGRIFVREKVAPPAHRAPAPQPNAGTPQHMLVIGGGAAGFAAAEMLRREGYRGKLTVVSADESPPYDRPSLSKDYLAGAAREEWIPLRPSEFYSENAIELRLRAMVATIDPAAHRATLSDGEGMLTQSC